MQRLLVCKQEELQGFMLFTPARLHVRQQKRQEAGYIQVSNHELNELGIMKYKEFIANAAIQIMAVQCEYINRHMFAKELEDGTIAGPSDRLKEAASNAVIAAKAIADELEEDFVYPNKDLETNHKMSDFEKFFDEY